MRAKFLQITASVSRVEDDEARENLYALDVLGNVWWFSFPNGP
jgi:hypothetical protein